MPQGDGMKRPCYRFIPFPVHKHVFLYVALFLVAPNLVWLTGFCMTRFLYNVAGSLLIIDQFQGERRLIARLC
jgi:hypothetical protein